MQQKHLSYTSSWLLTLSHNFACSHWGKTLYSMLGNYTESERGTAHTSAAQTADRQTEPHFTNMKQKVFIILLVSGLCTLCSCLSRQYHFVNIEKSWTEAQSYCRKNYNDLATIENQEEMEALVGVVGSGFKGEAWIGLYDDRDSWQWSLAERGFYSEGQTEFRNWASREPNNYNGSEHCVEMYTTGLWNDCCCDDEFNRRPFICYDGGAAQRYILITESKTWREAQSYCRENHTDLASVRNQAENQEIQQIAGEMAVWIGLFRESWKWSDQSSSSYRYWRSGEPNNAGGNEKCGEVWLGYWNDANCELKKAFICSAAEEREKSQECLPATQVRKRFVMRVELRPTSALNMKDSAVSEAILLKIEKKLKEQGMPEFTLRWRRQPNGELFLQRKEDEEKKEGV
ncbi:hypothetical protein AGOR_G00032220 [Albula goreensis]|uniref:C-type lectin domain-containing protein n=1 Tax=Albula goreensis TaxID=1534307 RepID=A0A8T3DZ73_9TELE|nr:hypothetical protein AGOR_G00032220 [Albula goreensis]